MNRLIEIPYRITTLIKPALNINAELNGFLKLKPSQFDRSKILVGSRSSNVDILYSSPLNLDKITDKERGNIIKPSMDLIYFNSSSGELCFNSTCSKLNVDKVIGIYSVDKNRYVATIIDHNLTIMEPSSGSVLNSYGKWSDIRIMNFNGVSYILASNDRKIYRSSAIILNGKIRRVSNLKHSCRDIYCIISYYSKGNSNIIYGDMFSDPKSIEISGKVDKVYVGYNVYGSIVNNKHTLAILNNERKIIDIPSINIPIAWIRDLDMLLTYNPKTGWIIMDDLKTVKTILVSEQVPVFLGNNSSLIYLLVDNRIKILEYESVIQTLELPNNVRGVSVSDIGLVIDYGNRLEILDNNRIDNRITIAKNNDSTCYAYRDGILCIMGLDLAIIDPYSSDVVLFDYNIGDYIDVAISNGNRSIDLDIDSDGEIISTDQSLDEYRYRMATRKYITKLNIGLRINAFINTYVVNKEITVDSPKLTIERSKLIYSISGVNNICGANSIVYVSIKGMLKKYNSLNKFILKIYDKKHDHVYLKYTLSREDIKNLLSKGYIDLILCVNYIFKKDSSPRIDLIVIDDLDEITICSRHIDVEIIEPKISFYMKHYDRYSTLNVYISEIDFDSIEVKIKCMNRDIVKSGNSSLIDVKIIDCETPSHMEIYLRSNMFMWIIRKDLVFKDDISQCLKNNSVFVSTYRCEIGGFYKYIEPFSIVDYTPFRVSSIFYIYNNILIEGEVLEPFCYTVIYGSYIQYGCVDNYRGRNYRLKINCNIDPSVEYIYFYIYNGRSVREYMLKTPKLDLLINIAIETSYKLYNYLERVSGKW